MFKFLSARNDLAFSCLLSNLRPEPEMYSRIIVGQLYLSLGNRTHDLRIRSTVTLPTELRDRTEKVGDDLGGESWRK